MSQTYIYLREFLKNLKLIIYNNGSKNKTTS